MTATPILENLAREFSTRVDFVQNALEMLDAGLSPAFIGRFRRQQVGELSESMLRRIGHYRQELEELDRRRGTILRLLERENVEPGALDAIRGCMDRFELEDLFIPHRRPEPEVQLALDRGLGALADLLVAPLPKSERALLPGFDASAEEESGDEGDDDEGTARASARVADAEGPVAEAPVAVAEAPGAIGEAPGAIGEAPGAIGEAPGAASEAPVEHAAAPESEPVAGDASVTSGESAAAETAGSVAVAVEERPAAEEHEESDEQPEPSASAPTLEAPATSHAHIDVRTAINAHLARLCQPYVRPDKGIHTETEALSGALRILSDRLGRSARLRSTLRRLLAKQGVLSVRATVDEHRLGRHKSLLRLQQPLRQVQGHRLLAIRQAQKERLVNTVITLDPEKALPKVRAALGRHTHPAHEEVLREIASQALHHRLLPMIEQDVRLELKERADSEALRFLSQHLRQILFTPVHGPYPVAGLDVNAKGDWTVVVLDGEGAAQGPEVKVETAGKEPAALGLELAPLLEKVRSVAIGHGKGPRAALPKIRAALAAANIDAFVFLVNEAGLSSYANSELARSELPERPVPARMAISLGRRLQDPMAEILKVDPRHLGLGSEQGLVSKANAKRMLTETIESCAAHVGCDVNRASAVMLQHLPGIGRDTAKKIVARRAERPIQSREELRAEGLLSEAQWTSAIAFLRVPNSSEPLDATSLHPEQYPLVRRMLDSAGTTIEQGLGRPGVTKGMRRADFDVDEATWRDLMREISYPGRDPRLRLFPPKLLEADTDPIRLVKDRVVEGIVSNVASFGTFVDVGLAQDAMIHISEISERYVRDARELLSIGQAIRARITDANGPRLALSLKHVPPPVREGGFDRGPRGPRGRPGERQGERQGDRQGERSGGDRGQGRGGPRGRGGRDAERAPEPQPNLRAAQTRRDGLGGRGGGGGRDRRGGFGGGKGGPGRGRGDGAERTEHVRLDKIDVGGKPAFTPFASFFKPKENEPETPAS